MLSLCRAKAQRAGIRATHRNLSPLVDQRVTEVEFHDLDDHAASFASPAAGAKAAETNFQPRRCYPISTQHCGRLECIAISEVTFVRHFFRLRSFRAKNLDVLLHTQLPVVDVTQP
jgi:hypothetical protein